MRKASVTSAKVLTSLQNRYWTLSRTRTWCQFTEVSSVKLQVTVKGVVDQFSTDLLGHSLGHQWINLLTVWGLGVCNEWKTKETEDTDNKWFDGYRHYITYSISSILIHTTLGSHDHIITMTGRFWPQQPVRVLRQTVSLKSSGILWWDVAFHTDEDPHVWY